MNTLTLGPQPHGTPPMAPRAGSYPTPYPEATFPQLRVERFGWACAWGFLPALPLILAGGWLAFLEEGFWPALLTVAMLLFLTALLIVQPLMFIPRMWIVGRAKRGRMRGAGTIIDLDYAGIGDDETSPGRGARALVQVWDGRQSYLMIAMQRKMRPETGQQVRVSWHPVEPRACFIHESSSGRRMVNVEP